MLLTIIPTRFLTKSFVIKDSQKLREAIYGFYENKLNCSHKTEDSISAEMSRLTDCIEELNRCIEENRNKIKFYKNEIQELENRLKSLA